MKIYRGYLFCILLPFLASCSKDDEPDILPDVREREVRLILPSNGLGDMSFSDEIMRGVLLAQEEFGFTFYYHVPTDQEDAEKKIEEWRNSNAASRSLTILSSNEYEELVSRVNNNEEGHVYLLAEASSSNFDVSVFRFSGYGVSFLIGVTAYLYTSADTAVYLGGQRNHSYLEECYTGFRDGYQYAGGQEAVPVYLSDKPNGFSMAQDAFHMSDSLYRKYSFIYPVAGGSNSGIYRWLRNHPDQAKYTVGVDVDQSAYSDHIIGSMIKEIGRSLYDYIGLWMADEELLGWKLFDLQSGYTYFLLAEPFKVEWDKVVNTYMDIAIEKESEYNKGRYE